MISISKKNFIILILLFLTLIIAAVLITSHLTKKDKNNETINKIDSQDIKQEENTSDRYIFTFRYYYGTYAPSYYNYDIYSNASNVSIDILYRNGDSSPKEIHRIIDFSELKKLDNIIQKYKIYKWDGFNKGDSSKLDGNGFSLSVEYSDGTTIKAAGYEEFPSNYKSAHNALAEFLWGLKDSGQEY